VSLQAGGSIPCWPNAAATLLVITSDKGESTCFCPCSFVCLSVSEITQNACINLHEMLRVDRCRDMDNWLTFQPDPHYMQMPEPHCFLRYRISAATQNFITSGKSHVYILAVRRCSDACFYKKLSCRRETARRFVSLNILQSHPRSLKVIRNDTVEEDVCKSLLVFRWNYVSNVVPFLGYSASKNGVTLMLGVWVVQGYEKWRRSVDHVRLSIGRPLWV